MPLSTAFFSSSKSASTLHKTKKHWEEFEQLHSGIKVQRFFISTFLQSKMSNCEYADLYESKGVIDSGFGKQVPLIPVSLFRNESKSSFCSIFRPTMLRKPSGIELRPACFAMLFYTRYYNTRVIGYLIF